MNFKKTTRDNKITKTKSWNTKGVWTYLHCSQKMAGGQKDPEYERPKYISAFARIILDSNAVDNNDMRNAYRTMRENIASSI